MTRQTWHASLASHRHQSLSVFVDGPPERLEYAMKYGTLYAAAAGLFAPLAAIAATPPLSQGVLDTLAKQDASTYKFFALHNTTESNIAGRQILERRAAPNNLNGLIETCTADSCLVYTFDDGPFDYHKLVVDMAVKSNIKVTFFVNVSTAVDRAVMRDSVAFKMRLTRCLPSRRRHR